MYYLNTRWIYSIKSGLDVYPDREREEMLVVRGDRDVPSREIDEVMRRLDQVRWEERERGETIDLL